MLGAFPRTSVAEDSPPREAEPIPELEPWREVGWIFTNGSVVAVERRGDEVRSRAAGI